MKPHRPVLLEGAHTPPTTAALTHQPRKRLERRRLFSSSKGSSGAWSLGIQARPSRFARRVPDKSINPSAPDDKPCHPWPHGARETRCGAHGLAHHIYAGRHRAPARAAARLQSVPASATAITRKNGKASSRTTHAGQMERLAATRQQRHDSGARPAEAAGTWHGTGTVLTLASPHDTVREGGTAPSRGGREGNACTAAAGATRTSRQTRSAILTARESAAARLRRHDCTA